MSAATNRQVGEFILEQSLGGTETAKVYRAYQPALNRYVALKVSEVIPDSESPLYVQRFMQEAEVLTSLEHPHIVPIYHYGIVEDHFAYISMRLMHGSLRERLEDGPLPAERVVEIALQLMAGLQYAHKKGVIHHDIKPTNILFDEVGSACLTDFGISKIIHHSLDIPRSEMMNTAVYAAPEQIRNASTDHRSDIYSLGVIMYQMLTGHLPYATESVNIVNLLQQIEHEQPVPLRNFNPDIPVEVERVVMQALRKEPRERFFDTAEMMEALQTLPSARPTFKQRPSSMSLRLPKAMKRTPRQRNAMLVLRGLIVVTVIALVFLLNAVASEQNVPHPPTVIAAEHASVELTVPNDAEIAQAQQRLGERGFIAYIACSLDSQFQATRAREMSDFAETYGVAFRAYDSAGDSYQQITTIERARLDGARAIILCPINQNVLNESLTSVQKSGIPLVLTMPMTNTYGGVVIDTDNYRVGRIAGEYVGRTLAAMGGSARVVVLDAPDYGYSSARTQGFSDGLLETLPSAQIITTSPTATDSAASTDAIAELIRSGQTPDAIFSVTDTGAYGAITALSDANVDPNDVFIASVNAESLALDEIFNQHYLRATVDIGRESGSRGSLNAAIKLLGGGTLPQFLTVPSANLITRDIMTEQS